MAVAGVEALAALSVAAVLAETEPSPAETRAQAELEEVKQELVAVNAKLDLFLPVRFEILRTWPARR
jgi:hypothetical protein